jgi:anionic cell wall polymer biosynthesis LytR-Cps2A-Psr (LCP) family protein
MGNKSKMLMRDIIIPIGNPITQKFNIEEAHPIGGTNKMHTLNQLTNLDPFVDRAIANAKKT